METSLLIREEEFAAMEQEWNTLLCSSAANTPFLTHQWLYSWWQAFGTGSELYIILCYGYIDGIRTLVAIFPAYITKPYLFPIRRLRLLGSEVVTSDFLDVIVARGWEDEVLAALQKRCCNRGNVHLAELTDLRAESPFVGSVKSGLRSGCSLQDWPVEKICPYIALPETSEQYFSDLSRSVRKNFQYYRRKLEKQGCFLEIIQRKEELEQGMADFSRLHLSRRSQKGDLGIFASEAQKKFYSDIVKRFFQAGWLELAFLNIDGKRVAGVCQFNYDDAIYYYQTGYDVAWEKSSVGFVLNGLLIERAIVQGKTSYEFLRGEEGYKSRLGAVQQRKLRDVYLTNGNYYGTVYMASKHVNRAVRATAKYVLKCMVNARVAKKGG